MGSKSGEPVGRDASPPPETAIRTEQDFKLQLNRPGDTLIFTSHDGHYVTINGRRFDASLALRAHAVHEDWSPAGFDALTEADFDYFLELKPEVLVFGTGARQHFAHPRLYRMLTEACIAVEFMDTAAACRTYNILVAEDRNVVAAILLESRK